MRLHPLLDARARLAIGAVGVLGALAVFQYWIAERRPDGSELTSSREFVVTSSADSGQGSLREAIFAADSARGRARIVIGVNEIVLRSPLPPLVNPAGIVVEAAHPGVLIDGREISTGALLEIAAPDSVVQGLRFVNAPAEALLIRADGFRLSRSSISDSDEGVVLAPGLHSLLVENMEFAGNRIGLRLESTGAGVIVRNNRFSGHRDAAVWAVRGTASDGPGLAGFALRSNRFESDRMGLVLANTAASVENNEFIKSVETAIYLIGAGAVVRGNRIRAGGGIGIFADMTRGTLIEFNEIDHNQTLAVLVRSSRDALVQRNRMHNNGYGMGFVLNEVGARNVAADNTMLTQHLDGIIVIGDSPILRNNQALQNRGAGIRLLDFVPVGEAKVRSSPLLERNTLEGNSTDEPARGEYRARAENRGS